jgi:tetratricopeptide (TPR) repeat protein
VLIHSRRYEEAVAFLESALKLDPQALAELAVAHSMLGEHEKAVAEFSRFVAMSPPHPFTRMVHAWTYARAGRREEATKILKEVLAYAPEERIKAAHAFGGTYIALGDHENALAWLKRGVEAGTVTWSEVNAAPWFDPLRSDPRFDALIEQAATKEKRSGR